MSFRNYYDTSSYGRNRDTGRTATTDRPTSVTAKYLNTSPSFKSSNIPIINRDRSSTREETPISAIANKYANYKPKEEKPAPKYEKKDYTKLTVPSTATSRSRDVSPVSTSSKYSLSRSSRRVSPERRSKFSNKARSPDPHPQEREKDIPNKTDKSTSYNGLSSYKIYPRASSYTRPSSRTESKPEITVNRYAIANRLNSNYLRSPSVEKSSRTSLSPISNIESPKLDLRKSAISPVLVIVEEPQQTPLVPKESNSSEGENPIVNCNESDTITVITRHTSPTPPGSSAYVRSRRADMAKTIEKIVSRPKHKPVMVDKEMQSDRLDDSTRASRFGSTARVAVSNWSLHTPSASNYTGYAGRYSTQYANLRDSNSPGSLSQETRSRSRSHSTEPQPKEMINTNSQPEVNDNHTKNTSKNITSEIRPESVTVYEKNNNDDNTSEIVINVNLKLKKAKSPCELISPEITITNSQLPPQAPKAEETAKTKKTKVRKLSTDLTSNSSSPKKKIVKKKIKSQCSSDSDQGNDTNSGGKVKENGSSSPRKCLSRNSSASNLQKKHSSSRESNSPESSTTFSTQSSISEDDSISKSKTQELSRTSADEASIPTDRSVKLSSPQALQKSDGGPEDAKSFLIRALAPVTNLFKNRNHDSTDSRWLESSNSESTSKDVSNLITESDKSSKSKNKTDNIVASNDEGVVKLKGIRHIESGERAWWLDQNSNGESKNEIAPQSTESSEKLYKKAKHDDEKPWWLDSSANIPEGIEQLTPPRKSSSDSEKFDFFKVRHIESGDKKDWWLTSSDKSSSSNNKQDKQNSVSKSESNNSFPLRRIRHVESGERPWWLSSSKNIPEGIEKLPTPPPQEDTDSSDSDEVQVYIPPSKVPPFPLNLQDDEPLGDRRSPEGLETPKVNDEYRGRTSPYENNGQYRRRSSAGVGCQKRDRNVYISRHLDIDDILGGSGQIYSPLIDSILARRTGHLKYIDDDMSECEEIDPTQVRIHDSTAQMPVIKKLRCRSEIIDCRNEDQLDDVALQVFKDGEYGPYLDLDSTLGEQEEELDGLQESRKNAIVLRTQLSVRVHTLIERLLQSQGRELRRALFSLKQVLQSDDDLVHEFVANKGLDALMQIGNLDDHNCLDYILRALGQILLYVDGMHGVMAHKRCIEWLYSLVSSKLRHVVKTALKLLLVFAEYTEKNCLLLIEAISAVDSSNGKQPWYNVMQIVQDVDASDTELLIYATTLINRCLINILDRNVYYDHVDSLQDQGMDDIIQLYMYRQGTDLDLLRQLQIFEAVLLYEDGDETGTALKQLDDTVINTVRQRSVNITTPDRRKSKKYLSKDKEKLINTAQEVPEPKSPTIHRTSHILPSKDSTENKELNSALRRRRDRYSRQAHHIIQQQEMMNNSNSIYNGLFANGITNDICSSPIKPQANNNGNHTITNGTYTPPNENHIVSNGKHLNVNGNDTTVNGNQININRNQSNLNGNHTTINGNHMSEHCNGSYVSSSETYLNGNCTSASPNGSVVGSCTSSFYKKLNGIHNGLQEDDSNQNGRTTKKHSGEILSNGNQRYTSALKQRIQNGTLGHSVTVMDALAVMRQKQIETSPETKEDRGIILTKEHSIKDLAQRLTTPIQSPTSEDKPSRVADMAGIVSKAKEELAKSQSKEVIKSPTIEIAPKIHEVKVSENDLHWEELKQGCLNREYHLCDLDFSDLRQDSDDDDNLSAPTVNAQGVPPPPPPGMFPLLGAPPPPPAPGGPFSRNIIPTPPPTAHLSSEKSNDSDSSTIKKNKKTVKLFWKEIQDLVPSSMKSKIGGFIWDELPTVTLDTKMLEHLFESRTNDLIIKEKISEPKRNLILDAKRSNAINIAMKKLPTPQTIKAAIMKMDPAVIGREGIEKLLTMLPTDEEKVKIQEAQYANPDLPLGSAEQFLLTLASISELSSRLKLWVFKLDFDNLEKEIAEPLMDLKQGIELLKVNKTFMAILATLRSVGSFLNGSVVRGFRLEYLSKVTEVKDTVHKHPLLYHICEMIIEKFPESTDFFSEVGPVIRASKVDFNILSINLQKLEIDCKASWDHMKKIVKHDGSQIFKTKINEFLTDAAERIILLNIIKKRVMNRYNKFVLYLGVPPSDVEKTNPSVFLKVIAEFALEYRTSRERVLLQLERKANHRERNKTRGKMIIDVANYNSKNGDTSADNALKELLKPDRYNGMSDSRRKLSQPSSLKPMISGDFSGEDEIIESLVRSATSKRGPTRERRKNRISADQKKSYNRRTLSPGNQQTWPSRETGSESSLLQQR